MGAYGISISSRLFRQPACPASFSAGWVWLLKLARCNLLVVCRSNGSSNSSSTGDSNAVLESLTQSALALLAAALPDSPGSQFALHSLGGTRLLLTLLRAPSNSPSLGLSAIYVLALLANKHSPGALVEVTAGGLVAVVMNVLQQQAMAGVLVSEVSPGVLRQVESEVPGCARQGRGSIGLSATHMLQQQAKHGVLVSEVSRTVLWVRKWGWGCVCPGRGGAVLWSERRKHVLPASNRCTLQLLQRASQLYLLGHTYTQMSQHQSKQSRPLPIPSTTLGAVH